MRHGLRTRKAPRTRWCNYFCSIPMRAIKSGLSRSSRESGKQGFPAGHFRRVRRSSSRTGAVQDASTQRPKSHVALRPTRWLRWRCTGAGDIPNSNPDLFIPNTLAPHPHCMIPPSHFRSSPQGSASASTKYFSFLHSSWQSENTLDSFSPSGNYVTTITVFSVTIQIS